MSIKVSALVLAMTVAFTAQAAHAGYSCQTADKKTKLEVIYSWLDGFSASMLAPEVSAYYAKSSKLKISTIESVIDPETHKAVTEVSDKGYQFMVYAPKSGTDTVWGLTVNISGKKAKAVLQDMAGASFKFDFVCEQTADLE